MKKIDYEKIYAEAFEAARKATDDYLKRNPDAWFPCGFAWVHFPNARSPEVNAFKKLFPDKGHKNYKKGWDVWDPSRSSTQCMDAKAAGCDAFVDVLNRNGIVAYTETRWD
jgi:hypothetical protein